MNRSIEYYFIHIREKNIAAEITSVILKDVIKNIRTEEA